MQLDLSLYLHAFMEQPASSAMLSILAVNSEAFHTKFSKPQQLAQLFLLQILKFSYHRTSFLILCILFV
jgi:hypothetical protein